MARLSKGFRRACPLPPPRARIPYTAYTAALHARAVARRRDADLMRPCSFGDLNERSALVRDCTDDDDDYDDYDDDDYDDYGWSDDDDDHG